ncbi:sigma factor sigX-regulated lipoprotein SrpA [Leptospira noguchii]
MKQSQWIRKNLKVFVYSIAVVFSIGCKKDKNGTESLLLAAILLNSNNAEFRLTDRNTLATGLSQTGESSKLSQNSNSSGFLITDLAGDNPQNYGDGNGDGFNDHFLTPKAVSIGVCRMVAYKSVAKGGPAKGSETLDNSNITLFKMSDITKSSASQGTSSVCAQGNAIIPLKGVGSSHFLRIDSIPDSEIQDYDRVGIVASEFTYYFAPEDVTENSYRYVSLILNNLSSLTNDRGTVYTTIFQTNCPTSFLDSPNYFGESSNSSCNSTVLPIDSGSGLLVESLGHTNPTENPEKFINPPSAPTVPNLSQNQKLKFKLPVVANNLKPEDPYILILDLNTSSDRGTKFRFDISVDQVLFWDSNSANNVFSPQLDIADRPNATDGADNLATTSRRNLIFHLPTILGKTE